MSRSGDEGSGDMLELCFHTAREDALRRHIQPRAAAAPPPITILYLHPLYRFSMLQSCYGPHTKRRQQQALNFSGLSYRTMCVCETHWIRASQPWPAQAGRLPRRWPAWGWWSGRTGPGPRKQSGVNFKRARTHNTKSFISCAVL